MPSNVGSQRAQPAVPADRFAREIVRFLAVCVVRVRRLNGNPLCRFTSTVRVQRMPCILVALFLAEGYLDVP
ncbi:MAG: hypothetical protein M3R61_21355, partial [Chloroflexota bacterium]|nr:hypothetical protein [Chloroflexota bacterium]